MGFINKTWVDPINIDASNINRIEQGIKNSHDNLEILNEEVANLQEKRIDIDKTLSKLLDQDTKIAEEITKIISTINSNNITTTSSSLYLTSLKQTLTKEELYQVYSNLKLNDVLRFRDIKVNGNSIYTGDTIDLVIPTVDNKLNAHSTNAISNKAVAEVLKNFNPDIKVPTSLSELKQDKDHMTVTAEEKAKWNSGGGSGGSTGGISSEIDPTVPAWAKEPLKPFYSYSEILGTPNNLSDFNNDLEFTTTTYVDSEIDKLQNILLGPDGDAALDTINELASAIENNSDIIETLNQAITNKAAKDHTHKESEITDLQNYSLSGHTHTKSEITDFTHTHTKSAITDFTHTHTKSEITDFGNYLTATSSLKEAYLDWGGKAISGAISPLDTAISNRHNANRFAFAKPAGIIIEYSTDGSTYSTYSTTDAQKINLVSGLGQTYNIGARSSGNTVNDKLRVTLIGGTMGVYIYLRKILLNISTNYATGCNVKIEYSMHTSQDTFTTLGTYALSGWSGWNSIPISLTYGGANSWSAYALRLTFGITGINSNQTSNNLQLIDIVGIGDSSWSFPSTMAKTGHLYNYDSAQNAVFPASITTNKGATIKGRVYGSGDDEGLIIPFTDNGYAGVILGNYQGNRSIFYHKSDGSKPFWRYSDGTNGYDITHPGKAGTIALKEDTSFITSSRIDLTRSSGGDDTGYYATRSDTNVSCWFGVGSGGTNHGFYSLKHGRWILYCDNSKAYLNANTTVPSGITLTISGSIVV